MKCRQVFHHAVRDAAPQHIEAFFVGVAGVDTYAGRRQNRKLHRDIAVTAAKVENIQVFAAVALNLRGINVRLNQLFALVRDQIILVDGKFFGVLQVSPLPA